MQTLAVLAQTAGAALRITIGAIIAVGIIEQLEPFPWYAISQWQARIAGANFSFPGSEVFFWFTQHWLELAVIVGLIELSRLNRALRRVPD